MTKVLILTGDAAESLEVVDGPGIVDGVMVSGRAWPDHPQWMSEFVRILREREPVEDREAVAV